MTTTSIFHGIKTNLLSASALALATTATAVLGIVVTGDDADATVFPLNRPVLINDVRAAITSAGTNGTLKPTLTAIAQICSPLVVVVRVATAAQGASQDDLVTGTSAGGYTGIQALLMAESLTGYKPRILGTPGLTSQATTQALVEVAQTLRSMVYAKAVADARDAAVTYADNFGARELMVLWPNTDAVGVDVEARALAMRAYIDATIGWHKTISNVEVAGINALEHDVSWAMGNDTSDAAILNSGKVTTLFRRNGWRFWGNRTTSADPFYAFESATRTSQVLADTIEDGLLPFVDKPITTALIKDILATINAAFRKMVTNGQIIGATATFDPALNSAADLAAGKLVISYDFTPAAPLEGLTLNQTITDRYYADFAALMQAA